MKMPLYEFVCDRCHKEYDELAPFDKTGKYPGVKCPACGSKKKEKQMSLPATVYSGGPNETFTHKAGRLMERAKGERRAAEAASHMGADPHKHIDDTHLGEGLHHPFPIKGEE
jgi:putative FmdB family regulatory protein